MAVAACGGDTLGFGEGSVRGLALKVTRDGEALVEYGAPPLVERRRMPTYSGDSGMFVLLHDRTDGGFYAMRFAGGVWWRPGTWELVRYDADWHVVAVRPGAELVDTLSLVITPHLRFTPDGRYLIVAINALVNAEMLLVLDPITLTELNRTGRPPPLVLGPTADTTASQVLLISVHTCPTSLIWLDVVTGETADSTAMPCDYDLHGTLTHRQVYRYGPLSGQAPARLELYDIATGSAIATADSASAIHFWRPPLAADGRLIYFGAGTVAVLDAQRLTLLGRVPISPYRDVASAVIDDRTGALFGATRPPGCVTICDADGIIVIDVTRRQLVVEELTGGPIVIVR
jgi:hypothetical protein